MHERDDRQQIPDRGRRHDMRDDYDSRREDSYRRQEYSTSPGAQHRSRSWRRPGGDRRHEDGEDDHHRRRGGAPRSDERRRDFDVGNYSEMYDEPRRGDERPHRDDYDDRQRDYDRSRSHSRHRRRSWSRSPTREAGQPNDTVILEGLPHSVSTNELRESLVHHSIAMEFPNIDIRVQSSRGQRRAFVQFESLDNAVTFVNEHYPKLLVTLQEPTDAAPDGQFEAYLHYARRREEWDTRNQGNDNGNWNCPSCNYSNYPTRAKCKVCETSPMDSNWQQSLTGAADASNTPSQILVIYPLGSFVNEAMLAADVKRLEREKPERSKTTTESGAPKLKSTAPGAVSSSLGAREGSLHRVFLMRDVNTDESFKYGFAEFWTLEDATAALAKFNMARSFSVAGCAVTIATIHMGVFLPEDRELDDYLERQSFHPLFNPSLRVRYRDPHVYPSQMVVTTEPPHGDQKRNVDEDTADPKKGKKRKAEGPLSSSAPKKTAAPMGGQISLWQKKHDEIHDGTVSGDGPGQTQTAPGASPPKIDQNAPIKISLSGSTIGGSKSSPNEDRSQSPPDKNGSKNAAVSYVDRERLMCLICMRKYKSVDEVNIHERSRNHKNATEKDELVKAALPRLAIRDKRRAKQASEEASDQQDQQQYRDRAKERRQAFNQPTKPAEQSTNTTTNNGKSSKSDGKPPKPEDAKLAAPAVSKGAGMLAKMGWTAGAGLGADGSGRTEAITTMAYQEGAGLGAEGAKLGDAAAVAERKTTGSYKDYVNTVQDKARERYNNLG